MKTKLYKTLSLLFVVTFIVMTFSACSFKAVTQYENEKDLYNKKVISEMGTTFAAQMMSDERFANTKYLYSSSEADSLGALFGYKADAIITDRINAESICSRYDNVFIIDPELEEQKFAFAFKKGSRLKDDFSIIMDKFICDGTIDEIINKWIGNDESEKKVMDQDWETQKDILKVAVNIEYEPVCYCDADGNIKGLDVDILLHIAKALGYKVEFITASFDDLISLVMAGKADIAISGISITKQRLNLVDFSSSYYNCDPVFVVRNEAMFDGTSGLLYNFENSFQEIFLESGNLNKLWKGLLNSVIIIIATFILGNIFGFAVFYIYYTGNRNVKNIIEKISSFVMLIPTSTTLLIMYYLVFMKSLASPEIITIVGLGFLFTRTCYADMSASASMFTQEETDAALSMGYTKKQVLFNLILPNYISDYFSSMKIETIYLVRDTSLAGMINALDIQLVLDNMRSETTQPFLPLVLTALIYISLAYIMSLVIEGICVYFSRKNSPQVVEGKICTKEEKK